MTTDMSEVMPLEAVERVLGRAQHEALVRLHETASLGGKRVLVTGANGSIGTKLSDVLTEGDCEVLRTDVEGGLEYLDVTDFSSVFGAVNKFQPNVIINLAGLKYAPRGEHETWKTVAVNTIGTKHLIDCAPPDCRVVLTSTCKSCNPEIVYGASKLIAERMTLNSGGSVVRYFNVVQTQGNVFETWRELPEGDPISVVEECNRHFISVAEAAGLAVFGIVNPPGRYIVNAGDERNMKDVAAALYPDRVRVPMPRRRGDRISEKFLGSSERVGAALLNDSVLRIENDHDLLV
jgi:FlaA1/EpsC-like NDP-sugar epimerase